MAMVVVLASCGAGNNDAARVNGATGGAGSPGASGGSPTGGSSSGGTGGIEPVGGAAGGGGAVVPDPPGPGIACGDETCTQDSEMCCVSGSDRWCDEHQCSAALARLECDDNADCPGERCCYTNIMESNWIMTLCSDDCEMWSGDQVCTQSSDCANDEACHVFLCGALDAASRTVAIGLCTATAPYNCE